MSTKKQGQPELSPFPTPWRLPSRHCVSPARLRCLLLFAALLAASLLHAEIIDRIAVSVGNLVITASDLDRQIRVTAFLDRAQPDFSPASRRATAARMVEQKLILRELDNSRYPPPAASEVDPLLDKFKRDNFPSDDEYRRALAACGIGEQDVKDVLLWQRRLLLFVDVRFRPGVQVTVQDIRDYYNRVVEPAALAAHPGQSVALDDYREQIEAKLTGEQTDRQMNAWLDSARRRTEVVYHPEAFE